MPPRPTPYLHEYDHRHFSFVRDTKLPRGTFKRPLEQVAAEWSVIVVVALALAGAIVLLTY